MEPKLKTLLIFKRDMPNPQATGCNAYDPHMKIIFKLYTFIYTVPYEIIKKHHIWIICGKSWFSYEQLRIICGEIAYIHLEFFKNSMIQINNVI